MKKIVCLLLTLVMCLGLCACSTTVVDGEEVEVLDGYFAVIRREGNDYLVYDMETKVVYYLESGSDYSQLSAYQMYQDGAIYGAVYENGQIVAKPYAMGITEEMVENYFNGIFG